MPNHRNSLQYIRIALDVFVLILSFVTSIKIISQIQVQVRLSYSEGYLLIGLFVIWLLYSRAAGLYDEFRSRNFSFEFMAILKGTIVQTVSTVLLLFFFKYSIFNRTFVIVYSLFLLVFLVMERFLFRRLLNWARRRGRNLRNIIIIGAGDLGKNFFDSITGNPHFGYNLVGFLDDNIKPSLNGEYLGKISDLDKILRANAIDDVIVALPNYAVEKFEDVLHICENHTTRVKIIPDYFKFSSDKFTVTMFGRYPVVSVRNDKINEIHWRLLKRGFDTLFTLFLFVICFWWLWAIIAVIIKLTSKGPVFFQQIRWGRSNKRIKCYKFRSMKLEMCDKDERGEFKQASKNDPRITNIGKFLRRTNLDELPQFLNVLKGEMSIVGPRPHPLPLSIESRDKVQKYMLRTLVKPGITGWAQVHGFRGETKEISLMQKRVDYDLWYIENWSFGLDMQIIALTVWKMLKGDENAY